MQVVGQLCSMRDAGLLTSPVWALWWLGCAAGLELFGAFVLGHSRGEGAAGDCAGGNTAGADVMCCCLLAGF